MKSIEELNTLKEKVESVNKKLAELTEDELAEVSGGRYIRDLVDTYQFAYTGIVYSDLDSSQTESH